MAINKVIYGNDTLIDISDTTAQASNVENGKDFYLNDGTKATGNYIWNWMGSKPEFIETLCETEYALEDTLYNGWEPSTTAKAIVASSNLKTFVADMVNYEYILVWKVKAVPVYNEGTVLKAAPIKETGIFNQVMFRRPNSAANIANNNFNSNACVTLYSTPLNVYYNTSGTLSYTYSISYGLYGAATAVGYSSTTKDNPTVTIKTPTINAKCHASYFATNMAEAIDQENSKIYIIGELYRIPVGSTIRSLYNNMIAYHNEVVE